MSKGFHTGRAMMGKDDINELILRRRKGKKSTSSEREDQGA